MFKLIYIYFVITCHEVCLSKFKERLLALNHLFKLANI